MSKERADKEQDIQEEPEINNNLDRMISDDEAYSKPAVHLLKDSLKKQHIEIIISEAFQSSDYHGKLNFHNSDKNSAEAQKLLDSKSKSESLNLEETMSNIEEFNVVVSPEKHIKPKQKEHILTTPRNEFQNSKNINELDVQITRFNGTKQLQFSRFQHDEIIDKSKYERAKNKVGDNIQKIDQVLLGADQFSREEEKKLLEDTDEKPLFVQDIEVMVDLNEGKETLANVVSKEKKLNFTQYTLQESNYLDMQHMQLVHQHSQRKYDSKLDEIKMLKKKTKHLEKGIILFNNGRIKETIQYLIKIEEIASSPNNPMQSEDDVNDNQALDFAIFLFETSGLDKNKIGQFLGSNKVFRQKVNEYFFCQFGFKNMVIDVALRSIFKKLRLPKEFQEIERVIYAFSKQYWEQNSEKLIENNQGWTIEIAEILAMSILILNTNIHSDKIPKSLKLTKISFVKTNKSILKDVVSAKLLNDMYDRIQKQQFEAKIELQEKFFKRVNDLDHMPNEITRTELLKTKGTTFIKYGRFGKPHKRQVFLNSDETRLEWRDSDNPNEKSRYIKCSEIQNIMIGADHTKVMQKHKIPAEYDNFCISIITKKRSLDLRYDEQKTIQVWTDKIKKIIQNNSESRLEKDEQNEEISRIKRSDLKKSREVIDNLWRNEILLNWQNYWDPIRKKLKSQKVTVNLNEKEKLKVSKQLDEIYDVIDGTSEYEKKLKDFSKDFSANIYYIWHEGLPNFARICVWTMLIGNQLSLSIHLYINLKAQFRKIKLTVYNSQEPLLSQYLTPPGINEVEYQSALQNQSLGEETMTSLQLQLSKIHKKTHKITSKLQPIFGIFEISEILFQDIMIDVLGAFTLYRPDIGYMAGLEKILAQLIVVYLPYQETKSEDFSLEVLENELFTMFSNIVLTSNHLPSFYQNNYDEISWRLNFFDLLFDKELPQLSLHFKAINFSSQLYLYDWFLSLFCDILPNEIVWRVWDIYFLQGEVFLYQAALGILKFKVAELISNPLNQCLDVFKQLKKGQNIDEEQLFSSINSIQISIEEFEDFKEMQLRGQEKAIIFKLFI